MKKLTLATTALYLSIASLAFADSNTLDITQASVGTAAPTANFTQSGTNGFADISQTGANVINGVQLGQGAQLTALQQNSTSGPANTINYTGRINTSVTVNQYASNGFLTAGGSAGNTANIDLSGFSSPFFSLPASALSIDQIGFNNTSTVYDTFTGSPITSESISVVQYSDNVSSGNLLQMLSSGAAANVHILQQGGNNANFTLTGGAEGFALTQTNTADNASAANIANFTLNDTGGEWTQTGTNNDVEANLTQSVAYSGIQNGNGNKVIMNETGTGITFGDSLIDQTGNNNTITTTQNATYNSYYNIQQNGLQNAAYVTQSGTSNNATLTQTGNLNNASITQSGTGATAIVHQ